MSVNKKNTWTLWDLNKASFLMVVLPYIGFNWRELYDSVFFSVKEVGQILLFLIFVEIIFKKVVKRLGNYEKVLSVLFICFTVLFFYGNNIVIPIYQYITKSLHLYIKEKILFLIVGILLVFIFHYLFGKKNLWRVLNVFLGIYFLVNIFSSKNLNAEIIPPIDSIQNGYKHISENRRQDQKPIVLIVLDEYSSPDELYKIEKDSSVFNFSNTLKNKGWEVRNSSYTYESSTIHSISSLFNFNLSKDSLYDKQNTQTIVSKKMLKATLLDSLNSKGVAFNNFGIFHMGNTKPLTQLYLYPINFTEHFLIRTTYAEEKNKSGNFKFKNLIKSYGNIFEHNAYILNNLPTILGENKNKKSFTYVHLFIPHAPFYFGEEFPVKHVISFENYFLFWKFTNTKIEALLDSINKQGDYRIILTGDHGYRRNEHKENYHYSFTAFKGFDSLALKQIESIQDIGLLINAGFK
jgi:Sulfatase